MNKNILFVFLLLLCTHAFSQNKMGTIDFYTVIKSDPNYSGKMMALNRLTDSLENMVDDLPTLKEIRTRVESLDPSDATFYAYEKQRLFNEYQQIRLGVIESETWKKTMQLFYTEQLDAALSSTAKDYRLDGIIVLHDSVPIGTQFLSAEFNDNFQVDVEKHKAEVKSTFEYLKDKKGGIISYDDMIRNVYNEDYSDEIIKKYIREAQTLDPVVVQRAYKS